MGGSDFHGINPTTERAPGAIPFPRLHVDRFLAHAINVWERPLVEQLTSMSKSIMLAGPGTCASQELLIWKEQEPLVRRTLAELGMGVEISEGTQVQSTSIGDKVSVVENHYRTIRLHHPLGR